MSTFLRFLADGLALGGVIGIWSLGFAFSYWPSRQVHFGYAAVILVASYGYRQGVVNAHAGPIGGLIIGLAAAAAAGLLCYVLVYRTIRLQLSVFLAGFAILVLAENAVQLGVSADPLNVAMPFAWMGSTVDLSGVRVSGLQFVEFGAFLVVWAVVVVVAMRTKVGTQLRSIASNRYLADCTGIPVERRIKQAYIIGSVIGAIGSILYTIDQGGVSTTMAETPLFFALNGVLIGGELSISGAAIGGFLLGVVLDVGVWKLPTSWQTSIAFVLLALIISIKPRGLLAKGVGGHA